VIGMAIPQEELEQYAHLLVEVGANVAEGQIVAINAQPQHLDFVRLLTKVAYERGARYVDIWVFDPHSKLHRVQNASEETLGWTPPWLDRRVEILVEEKAAAITLRGDAELGLLSSLDPSRVAKDRMPRLSSWFQLVSSEQVNWTIGAYPTEGWAEAIYGEPDIDRLWGELRTFLRLDSSDPVAAWNDHLAALEKRAQTLTERRFDGLRYRGPGTDLFVGLIANHVWQAARFTTRWGREHAPNLPTEEVFTSPHRMRTEGTISSTKPLEAAGSVIHDLKIRFEDGRAVEWDATQGKEIVEGQLTADEGACMLGEVALVDRSSRIGQSGTIFFETLLDENATSHIAYGGGFPSALPNGAEMTEDERLAAGINASGVHTDFMVGGEEVGIYGVAEDGSEEPIIINNEWQL
jgi:aminopeptidase